MVTKAEGELLHIHWPVGNSGNLAGEAFLLLDNGFLGPPSVIPAGGQATLGLHWPVVGPGRTMTVFLRTTSVQLRAFPFPLTISIVQPPIPPPPQAIIQPIGDPVITIF